MWDISYCFQHKGMWNTMDISYRITNSLHGSVSSVAACCHRGPFVLWTSGVVYCAVQRCLWHSADQLDWNPEWNRPLLETLPLRTWKRCKNCNASCNCLTVHTMGTERMTNSVASSPEMLEFRRILHRPMGYSSTVRYPLRIGCIKYCGARPMEVSNECTVINTGIYRWHKGGMWKLRCLIVTWFSQYGFKN